MFIHAHRVMNIDPSTYPSRAFIRFTAENQLQADLTGKSFTTMTQRLGEEHSVQEVTPGDPMEATDLPENATLDQALFEEIAQITFNSNRYPELYQSCGTRKAAKAVELRVAAELVATYKWIKRARECPIVQSLNRRLQ